MSFSKKCNNKNNPVCNLNCAYCYLRTQMNVANGGHKISDEALEKFVSSYLGAADSDVLFFYLTSHQNRGTSGLFPINDNCPMGRCLDSGQ